MTDIVLGKLFGQPVRKLLHRIRLRFLFHLAIVSTLWNTSSAGNLTLTVTFLKQCEYLSTGRSLPAFARLTAWSVRFITSLIAMFCSESNFSGSDFIFYFSLTLSTGKDCPLYFLQGACWV
jgi:hypothetical protein